MSFGALRRHRSHPLWFAFLLHRVSGLALVLFLPIHFYLLSLALNDPAAFDGAIRFTEHPMVKIAEFGLVFLLSVHAFGGVRLIAMEWLPWSDRQKTFAAGALGCALLVSGTFFLKAI